jgi:hypothetical protein
MPLSLPSYPPAPGQKAKPSLFTGWFAAIIARFAAGIRSADMASDAGVTGGQISTASGTRVGVNNLEDGSVTNIKLRADATAGSIGAAVKRDNVVDGEITTPKLAAASIGKDKLKYTEVTQAFSVSIPLGSFLNGRRLAPSPPLPAYAAMLPIRLTAESVTCTNGSALLSLALCQEAAGTPFYQLGLGSDASSGGSPTIAGTIRFGYLALT